MRTPLVLAGVAAACTAVPLAGCVDLFHSTDFGTVAEADASSGDVGADAMSKDICVTPAADALAVATRACALLSACESPVGDNAIGRCLPNAIQAYDCDVARSRPLLGAVREYWACLKNAITCEAVERCVYGNAASKCGDNRGFTNCLPNALTHVDCETANAPAKSENCAATGRVCTANGGAFGYCSGTAALGCSGTGSTCEKNQLHACATGTITLVEDGGKGTVDEGFDCAGYGAGECVQNAIGASCKSNGESCPATNAVTCDGNVAVGCPSGTQERVDCFALTGGKPGTCTPTTGGRTWDVSRACGISATDGGAGCSRDECKKENGVDKLSACVRGVTVVIDCTTLDVPLGTCRQVETFDGARPACGRP